jgi:hypothetical protein
VSAAEWTYRVLMRAYPARFRAAYGREMALAFRDRRREPGAKGVGFWAELVWDVVRSAPALRVEELHARWNNGMHLEGDRMKTMSILAIVIGAFETVNALAEAWPGAAVSRGGYWLVTVAMAVVAGAALMASGVALLRRARGATALARSGAIACLAIFVVIGLAQPWMSILSRLLGVVFPIALLLFLYRTRGSKPSVPMVA